MTLAILGQWSRFGSERGFYRFAQCRLRRLRPLFPRLPARSQFNRQQRQVEPRLVAFFLYLAQQLQVHESPYEVLDRLGIATRWCGRRGSEWLAGYADKGLCKRLGFFHGLHLLSAVSARGVITGYGIGPGSAKDQPMAESLLCLRHRPHRRAACVGAAAASQTYVLDKGFRGPHLHQRWREAYGARILCTPQAGHGPAWPRPWRTWLAGLRQIVETVHDKLLEYFRLERERPHTMAGFFARMAAKAALHNFCIAINRRYGRPDLAFADLLGW